MLSGAAAENRQGNDDEAHQHINNCMHPAGSQAVPCQLPGNTSSTTMAAIVGLCCKPLLHCRSLI
jgi:hypothetical protein